MILKLFKKNKAILKGHFILSSGNHSDTYLQCALVLKEPKIAEYLGREIVKKLNFKVDKVISPALGGIIIGYEVARALKKPFIFTERKNTIMMLRRGFKIGKGERYLIVEDVITTGKSSLEVKEIVEKNGGIVVGFAAIVDRSNGKHLLPLEPVTLLKVNVNIYNPSECPLCKKGIPAVKPGSRNNE